MSSSGGWTCSCGLWGPAWLRQDQACRCWRSPCAGWARVRTVLDGAYAGWGDECAVWTRSVGWADCHMRGLERLVGTPNPRAHTLGIVVDGLGYPVRRLESFVGPQEADGGGLGLSERWIGDGCAGSHTV